MKCSPSSLSLDLSQGRNVIIHWPQHLPSTILDIMKKSLQDLLKGQVSSHLRQQQWVDGEPVPSANFEHDQVTRESGEPADGFFKVTAIVLRLSAQSNSKESAKICPLLLDSWYWPRHTKNPLVIGGSFSETWADEADSPWGLMGYFVVPPSH